MPRLTPALQLRCRVSSLNSSARTRTQIKRLGLSPVYNVVGVVNTFFSCRSNKPLVLRAAAGVKGGLAKWDVYRRPLTPCKTRQDCHRTKRELRLTQDSFAGLDQGSYPFESFSETYFHQPCIRSSTTNHDSFSELPLHKGGRALNQLADRLSPTTGLAGLPCMRADGTGCAASRSFQYSRTANFRAMATFATAPPRRNFNR